MSERLIIGLERSADWATIKRQLVGEGADWTKDPSPEQPDVLVVSMPEDVDIDGILQRVKEWPGVRYAERDAMRWTS